MFSYPSAQAVLLRIVGCGAVIASGGCGSYSALPLDMKDPARYEVHTVQGQLSFGGEAWGYEQAVNYLGVDVTDMTPRFASTRTTRASPKYLPMLLVIRNRMNRNVMIQRQDIELSTTDGRSVRPSDWTTVSRLFLASANTESYDLPTLAMSSGANSQYDADLGADWKAKSFPESFLVKPNQWVGGVVFYKNPGHPPYVVQAEVTDAFTQENTTLALEFEALQLAE